VRTPNRDDLYQTGGRPSRFADIDPHTKNARCSRDTGNQDWSCGAMDYTDARAEWRAVNSR
jgi:hypothetical protein